MSESEEEAALDEIATTLFTNWSSTNIIREFKERHDNLTKLSKDFIKICFEGLVVDKKSIYLKNEKMKEMLLGFDLWSPFIPTGTVGLHHKFKTNAGVLSHMIKQINLFESNEEKMEELNGKINSQTEYTDLEHLLDYGMYVFSCATIFFCIQVKMPNIWPPNPLNDHLKR